LRNQEFTFSKLTAKSREDLAAEIGQERFEAIADLPVGGISAEDKVKLIQALGKLSQNRIYRQLLLGTITESWVDYLTRMEALRVSISMESYAQRDPLVQYKSKASTMFTELFSEVRQTVISKIYRIRPQLPAQYNTGLRSMASAEPELALVGTASSPQGDPPAKQQKKRKRH